MYTFVNSQVYTEAAVRLAGLGVYYPKSSITNPFFAHIATMVEGRPRTVQLLNQVLGPIVRPVRLSTLDHCRKWFGTNVPGLFAAPGEPADETLADMAIRAAKVALASANLDASQIDVIVGASSSSSDGFPTSAGWMQRGLGLGKVRTHMLKGACASQVEAFQIAAEILATSSAQLVLVVAAEGLLHSPLQLLNWKISSWFSEGAAAYLFTRGDPTDKTFFITGSNTSETPVLSHQTMLRMESIDRAAADQEALELFRLGDHQGLTELLKAAVTSGNVLMDGKAFLEQGSQAMAEAANCLCTIANITPGQLTHIVPHQASCLMCGAFGDRLGELYSWPVDVIARIVDYTQLYGNLSTVSIAMALTELLRDGRLQDGNNLLLSAAGGGINCGAMLLRYHRLANPDAILAALPARRTAP